MVNISRFGQVIWEVVLKLVLHLNNLFSFLKFQAMPKERVSLEIEFYRIQVN